MAGKSQTLQIVVPFMSTDTATDAAPDITFYFDPVCPFAWMTSKWVRMVAEQRDYAVDWSFISLRQINAHIDYDAHFPEGYEAGHTAGLRLLRVAAKVRAEHGNEAVGRLYAALGGNSFDMPPPPDAELAHVGTRDFVVPILEELGLPVELADALEDESYDEEIQASTDEALSKTGKDVGTPIIHFEPGSESGGVAFFGPVISRLPSPEQAVELWEHVIGLARFGGFAELKRSLREMPQLVALGADPDDAAPGVEEDWHGGSRRLKK